MREEKIIFFKRMILFLIIFSILVSILGYVYDIFIIQKDSRLLKELAFEREIESIKILAIGDSHPARAFIPYYINNSYNFATPGETLEQTYILLKSMLSKQNNLSIIVLNYELTSFSDYRSNPYAEVSFWKRHMNYKQLKEVTGLSYTNLFLYDNFPFLGNGLQLNVIFHPEEQIKMYRGWSMSDKQLRNFGLSDDPSLQAVRRLKKQFKNFEELNPKLINAFKDILELTNKKNLTLVLVKYPVSKHYLQGFKDISIDLDENYKILNRIISEYNNTQVNNIVVLDYQKYIYEDKYFEDQDHLNIWGAANFSRMLSNELERLNVR